MSEPLRPCLAFLGLPRTGKSTFLGALWALVQSPLEPSVQESSFAGDRSYIQRLAAQVARVEEIDRTTVDADEEMAIQLAFESHGVADLRIPDTSGESLRLLVERRAWHPRLLAACEDATGILLFVHPERLRVPAPLSVLGAGGAAATGEGVGDGVPFNLEQHSATAAELIDVFENVTELCNDRWPIRFGVVVSAWDTVDGDPAPNPHEWMRTRLPGVLATMEENPDVARFEVFGVSAQGGSLDDRALLIAKGETCDRVFAVDRSGWAISLVEPVRWAIWGS